MPMPTRNKKLPALISKMKRLIFVFFLTVGAWSYCLAQFQTGVENSNQSGVLGITINPANSNQLSNGTDFMLAYGRFSIFNNDFYLPAKPITSVLKPEIFTAFKEKQVPGGETINKKFERLFDMHRSLKPNGYIFADVTVYGPSFLVNMGRHSFGLLTAFKATSSTINLPREMAIFLQKGVVTSDLNGKTFKLNNVKSGSLVYEDIAFNYSYQIRDSYKSIQRLGINMHYLIGINSMIFDDHGTIWSVNSVDSSILFTNGKFTYNYAATSSDITSEMLATRGNGFSVDLGYTYLRKNINRRTRTTFCPNVRVGKIRDYQTYKWKAGIALMDLGYINFISQTVTSNYIDANGPVTNLDLAFYKGLFSLDNKLKYGFGPSTIRGDNFITYLPTRLNIQFDYLYKENWFFNLSVSQRTPISDTNSIHASNIVSLTPRYETLNTVICFPISLIEYQYPILGLNIKYGPLIIGTNQLLEVIGIRTIKGVDFYFGLKFNISNIRGI